MNSIEYQLGYKIGKAIATLETVEEIFKDICPEEYKSYKLKIRRLSQCEAKELRHILLKDKCFSKRITFL